MAKKKRPQELHHSVLFLDFLGRESKAQLIRQLRAEGKPLIELFRSSSKYLVGLDSYEGFSQPKTFKPELFREIIKIFNRCTDKVWVRSFVERSLSTEKIRWRTFIKSMYRN